MFASTSGAGTAPVRTPNEPVGGARRILSAAAVTVAAALALSGCAAGQRTGTAKEVPAIDGTSVKFGDCTTNVGSCIALNATAIAPPPKGSYAKGSDAPIQVILSNSGQTSDELVGVTSEAATSVTLYKNASDASADASSAASSSGTASASPSASGSASGSASASASASASGSVSGSASASGSTSASPSAPPAVQPLTSLPIPSGSRVSVGYGGDTSNVLVLKSLKEALYPAQSIAITFTFSKAGQITVWVPVQLTAGPSSPVTVDIEEPEGQS